MKRALRLCAAVALLGTACSSDGQGASAGSRQPVEPRSDGCDSQICHLAMRFAYTTLEPLGYASVGGTDTTVTDVEVRAAAKAVFDANSEYLRNAYELELHDDLYLVTHSPGDFGAFALVSARTGAVVTAGGVVWAGEGRYWAPSWWESADDIESGGKPVAPGSTHLYAGDCTDYRPDAPAPASASDALDAALRTNLAAHYAERGDFRAQVYLYTPTVGGCNPRVAEYIVLLTSG